MEGCSCEEDRDILIILVGVIRIAVVVSVSGHERTCRGFALYPKDEELQLVGYSYCEEM